MNCRVCGQPIDRPDLTPYPDVHGACFIEEGKPLRHVHIELDQYGYCVECNVRVMANFRGWLLPDRP